MNGNAELIPFVSKYVMWQASAVDINDILSTHRSAWKGTHENPIEYLFLGLFWFVLVEVDGRWIKFLTLYFWSLFLLSQLISRSVDLVFSLLPRWLLELLPWCRILSSSPTVMVKGPESALLPVPGFSFAALCTFQKVSAIPHHEYLVSRVRNKTQRREDYDIGTLLRGKVQAGDL